MLCGLDVRVCQRGVEPVPSTGNAMCRRLDLQSFLHTYVVAATPMTLGALAPRQRRAGVAPEPLASAFTPRRIARRLSQRFEGAVRNLGRLSLAPPARNGGLALLALLEPTLVQAAGRARPLFAIRLKLRLSRSLLAQAA